MQQLGASDENLRRIQERAHKQKGVSTNPDYPFRVVLKRYQRQARERGLAWHLTDDQFRTLTSAPCYYTGAAPAMTVRGKASAYVYNGIDRLDPSVGYTPENCVPCCEAINRMKHDLALAEFLSLCHVVTTRFKRREGAA